MWLRKRDWAIALFPPAFFVWTVAQLGSAWRRDMDWSRHRKIGLVGGVTVITVGALLGIPLWLLGAYAVAEGVLVFALPSPAGLAAADAKETKALTD